MKSIAILQPGFLPWLGYFEQRSRVDLFVILDDVPYTKQDWRNRNRFKSPSGPKYLSVPVHKKDQKKCNINQVHISYDHPWQNHIINSLEQWYGSAQHFNTVFAQVKPVIWQQFRYLIDLNQNLEKIILSWLDIHTPAVKSSTIPGKSADKNQKLIDICTWCGADLLYDGQAAKNFLDVERFSRQGIQVVFQEFVHQPYRQLWGDFVPYLSALDLVFNHGPHSRDILLHQGNPLQDVRRL